MLLGTAAVLENAVAVVAKVAIGLAGLCLILLDPAVARNLLHQLPERHVRIDDVLVVDLLQNDISCNLVHELQFFLYAAAGAGLTTVIAGVRFAVLVDVAAALAVEKLLSSSSIPGGNCMLHVGFRVSLLILDEHCSWSLLNAQAHGHGALT